MNHRMQAKQHVNALGRVQVCIKQLHVNALSPIGFNLNSDPPNRLYFSKIIDTSLKMDPDLA